MALEKGVKAPDFSAEIEGGDKITLNEHLGKWIVLYFYPKDNTPGCTKEACAFRDNMERIVGQGAMVLGVSPDNPASHDKFKDQHDLNFSLISDPDKAICEKYDIIGEKKMFGKSYKGVIRTTYIIDPEGMIAHKWSNVKVNGHVEQVIKKLKELQESK